MLDGHEDLAYFLRWAHNNLIYLDNFTTPFESGDLGGEVDLGKLLAGRVDGAFLSTYCPKHDFSAEYHHQGKSHKKTYT